MKTINYVMFDNGMRVVTNNPLDKQMEVLENLTQEEFLEKFPNHSCAYGCDWSETYLENGTVLLSSEWNGYEWHSNDKTYRPLYQLSENSVTDDIYSDEAEFDYAGFYEA